MLLFGRGGHATDTHHDGHVGYVAGRYRSGVERPVD